MLVAALPAADRCLWGKPLKRLLPAVVHDSQKAMPLEVASKLFAATVDREPLDLPAPFAAAIPVADKFAQAVYTVVR